MVVAAQLASDPVNAYPTAPPTYGALLRKPTDVMGRRVGAYLLDVLITIVIVGGLTFAVMTAVKPLEHVVLPTTSSAHDFCSDYSDDTPGTVAHTLRQQYGNRACFNVNSDVYLLNTGPVFGAAIGFGLAWGIINFVLLEGLTGGTLGKRIVGLRVVRGDGQLCGVGRAIGRNAVLHLPSNIPIFGFLWIIAMLIVSLVRDNHQHLGDMAAGTYVVDRHAIGQPLDAMPAYAAPGAYPLPSGPGFGPPPSTLPPPSAAPPPAAAPAPAPGTFGPPPSGGGFGPPPAQEPPTQAPEPTPAAAPAAAQPQWDAARTTYIWWNPDEQRWLEHDQASGQWRPISQ